MVPIAPLVTRSRNGLPIDGSMHLSVELQLELVASRWQHSRGFSERLCRSPFHENQLKSAGGSCPIHSSTAVA